MRFYVTNTHNQKKYPAIASHWPEHGWHIQVLDPGTWGTGVHGEDAGPVIDSGFQKELEQRGWQISSHLGTGFSARDYVLGRSSPPQNVRREQMAALSKKVQANKPKQEALEPAAKPIGRFQVPPPESFERCACSDPGCPVCHGHCHKPGKHLVYRSDMEDETGTLMCDGCMEDAMNSGLFYTKESAAPMLVDLLLNEWQPGPEGQTYAPYDAQMLTKAIRLEMRRGLSYAAAKDKVLQTIDTNPDFYSRAVSALANEPAGVALGETKNVPGLKPMAHVKVTPFERQAGRKVEREHTTDNETADIIASHHHKERRDYYAKLKKAGLADELKEARVVSNPCECSDPECPACHGRCLRAAITNLVRVDMDDVDGTQFCRDCAYDAMSSGLFRESRSNYIKATQRPRSWFDMGPKSKGTFYPTAGGPSIEPLKEPPGSAADLKLGMPKKKANFYPSSGGPSSV